MSRYILIESGPIREAVVAMIDERDAAMKAWHDWAAKFGAKRVYHNERTCVGIDCDPKQPGWKQDRRTGMWSPKVSTKAGKAVEAEMKALPTAPDLGRGGIFGSDSIDKLLGWQAGNLRSSYLVRAGDSITAVMPGRDIMGFSRTQDLERLMAWPVPEGCREITEAEWDLIRARREVEHEAAAKAAAEAAA